MYAIAIRTTGYILSIALSLVTYFIIIKPESFNLSVDIAIIVIFALAFVQWIVQLICFIHIWKEKGPLWNFNFFLSTLGVLFVVIFFSIWIMDHLNYNMGS